MKDSFCVRVWRTCEFATSYAIINSFILQVESVHESLDRRISSLEKLKQSEAPQPLQATE